MGVLQTSLIISKRDKYEKITFLTTVRKTKATHLYEIRGCSHIKINGSSKQKLQICIQALKNNYYI